MLRASYLFYISKFVELFDTVSKKFFFKFCVK